MNSITICGNIARDAEIRSLPNGDPVANFTVADNMSKDKGAIFWACQIFGQRATSLSAYLKKGQPVTVTGTVSQRAYTKDGVEKTSMDIRVADVALQGGRKEESAQPQRTQTPPPQRKAPAASNFEDFETDCPF